MVGNSSSKANDIPGVASPSHVTNAKNSKLEQAIDHVMKGTPLTDITSIGNLKVLAKSKEKKRYDSIRVILEEYADRDKKLKAETHHARKLSPISIAVFGPPGSGKSTYVKEIVRSLETKVREPILANLSQLSDPAELALMFTEPDNSDKRTKVFFIDEFDAELKDISLGWLRYFLAPMQDGEIRCGEKIFKFGPAIFLFAGGTAPSLAEFEKRAKLDPASYREKKVPDFISRLRGFIDIQGINSLDNEREMRRALVLRDMIEKRWSERTNHDGSFPIDRRFVKSLLTSAHFIHGVRSVEALLDMCHLEPCQTLSLEHLLETELTKLHVSRGPLDGMIIGISAGLKDEEANGLLNELTHELLKNGATLAYGGEFREKGTLESIVKAAEVFPDDLVKRDDKRVRNYLGFPAFNSETAKLQRQQAQRQVDFLNLKTLSEFESHALGVPQEGWFVGRPLDSSQPYNPNHHLAWAISLFRMRVRLIQDISALIVVGGKATDEESWGRFSGIAEEVMLAITMDKPVYVLGGRGGAAQAIGQLLGLDEAMANPNAGSTHVGGIETSLLHDNFSSCFTMPSYPNLPRTIEDVRRYLFERSFFTFRWPWNGLDICENRELFRTLITTSTWGKCVELIINGLTRLEWAPSSSKAEPKRLNESLQKQEVMP